MNGSAWNLRVGRLLGIPFYLLFFRYLFDPLILGLILGLLLRMLVRKIPKNIFLEKNQAERSAYSEPRGPETLTSNFEPNRSNFFF